MLMVTLKRLTQEDAGTAYGESIEDSQGMNEEYKIWRVTHAKVTFLSSTTCYHTSTTNIPPKGLNREREEGGQGSDTA